MRLLVLLVGFLFWNLENFFGDPDASRHWTKSRFYTKANAVAKTILWTADEQGEPPCVIGVAEVDSREVLSRLVNTTLLRKYDYGFVHFDSPDRRGIDVALLYRRNLVRPVSSRAVHVRDSSGAVMKTRDILVVVLEGEIPTTAVLVNHHPSKYGGRSSAGGREAAARTMCSIVDSLKAAGIGRIVAMGDFNDTPDAQHLKMVSDRMTDYNDPSQGTIRYEGKWERIDLVYACGMDGEVSVLEPPFLTERDNAHSGDRPLRTYSGPRYKGGVSDHRPVLFTVDHFE
ncbi:MAG: hypothetical protein K5984_04685 [Bacteroidales bacterium]|nr:hypothetical protein [Bacteroidales bacterium]